MDKFKLFAFFLCGLINFSAVAWAQEEAVEVIANRPKVEYKSGNLRDPFQTYIIKEKKVKTPQTQAPTTLSKPEINFTELKVEGIIWGTKIPQAIINGKVYIVGDKINDAKIISIDQKGVNLSSAAGIFNLPAPGLDTTSSGNVSSINAPGKKLINRHPISSKDKS